MLFLLPLRLIGGELLARHQEEAALGTVDACSSVRSGGMHGLITRSPDHMPRTHMFDAIRGFSDQIIPERTNDFRIRERRLIYDQSRMICCNDYEEMLVYG